MREKINWWWFLIIAGILIPLMNYLFTHFDAVYFFFNGYFVGGLNPFLSAIGDFIIIALTCILFKIILRINIPLLIRRIFYVLSGIIVLYLFAGFLIPRNVTMPQEESLQRRYVDMSATVTFGSNNYLHLAYTFLAILIFALFFIINFPKRINK